MDEDLWLRDGCKSICRVLFYPFLLSAWPCALQRAAPPGGCPGAAVPRFPLPARSFGETPHPRGGDAWGAGRGLPPGVLQVPTPLSPPSGAGLHHPTVSSPPLRPSCGRYGCCGPPGASWGCCVPSTLRSPHPPETHPRGLGARGPPEHHPWVLWFPLRGLLAPPKHHPWVLWVPGSPCPAQHLSPGLWVLCSRHPVL